jgi:hypothetical protein
MTQPFLMRAEYVRLTRPSEQRFAASSRRAWVVVFRFTFGTTQRTTGVGGRTGGGGGAGGAGDAGGAGEGEGGGGSLGGGGG